MSSSLMSSSFCSKCATFFLLVVVGVGTTQAATLAHWRFEEGTPGSVAMGAGSVIDSQSTFHGTPVGGPRYSADVPVDPVPQFATPNGVSLDLGNGQDYVVIPDPTSVLIPTNALTVEAWLKSSGTQPETQVLVVDHSHGWTDTTGWALQSAPGSTKIDFIIGNGTAFKVAQSVTNVFDGEWHHVAGVYDLSDSGSEMKLYIDGILEAVSDSGGALAANTRDVVLGASWHGAQPFNRFFHGLVDEVRISSAALSPSQFLSAPEPSSLLLLVCGLIGVGSRRSSSM